MPLDTTLDYPTDDIDGMKTFWSQTASNKALLLSEYG